MSFVPLHVHSQYSILDSTCAIKKLCNKAKDQGLPALALTDHGNLFGAVEFFKTCKGSRIKPLIGCELWIAPTSRHEKKRIPGSPAGYPTVFIAKDREGYHNLCKLSSIGYLEGFYYYPRIDREVLEKYHKGLICLSGSMGAEVPSLISQDKFDEAKEKILWFKELFQDDYYLELIRNQMTPSQIQEDGLEKEGWLLQTMQEYVKNQEAVVQKLITFSKELSIKCVAANDTHYLDREDWRAHEVLINVGSGERCLMWERDSAGNPKFKVPNPKRKIYPTHALDFKSPDEMKALFPDALDSLTHTLEVADKCSLELDFKTKHYPVFIPPHLEGKEMDKQTREKEANQYLWNMAFQAIEKRYSQDKLQKVQEKYPDEDPLEVVKKRLKTEFDIISSKGMCDYLLIVHDFIFWAKKQGIPVGPGRGSAAGSIISYLIGITDIEPLRFNLFFERFINPERVSYPDIDVDICMDRRQEVIDYMIEKYGKERVAQIITFGTMKAKMAIKDVGRVLSVPLAKVNQIAKLVPDDLGMTLERALKIDPELKNFHETDPEAKTVIDMALKNEGSIRNTSIHAAGLIVSEKEITEHIPVCTAKDADMTVTQYAMKPVEAVGMLKIDFLGLKTLTSIQRAAESVKRERGITVDWQNLPLDNKTTFALLNQGKTLGVFQVESGGMQDLARQLHIDTFEEIIAVGALYRPGPMDMIPTFINRKHGREEIEIDHPLMKEILQETYGVMVYQEQVMQIASLLAGYSLGEGDMLRRAMGKKDAEEMQRQRVKFLQGAKEKGIAEEVASTIFNKIEKFASYGFNKSHAAAYAYLTYTTAYFKANYPTEWMAALMTCDRDDLTKVAKFIGEAKAMGIAILPPDVNKARDEFVPTKEGIRFAMSGIKGVGSSVVEAIREEREKRGPYQSLYDFIQRVDKHRVGKKNIELMVLAGCFDFTGWTRDQMKESVEQMFDEASREEKDASSGVMNFFSLIEEESQMYSKPPEVKFPLSELDKLKKEKELLGFYLTGHPMHSYQDVLEKAKAVHLEDLEKTEDPFVVTGFVLDTLQFKIASKSGRKFAILTISDGGVKYELPIWPEMCEEKQEMLEENHLYLAILQVDRQDGSTKLNCKYLSDLTAVTDEEVEKIEQNVKTLKRIKKSKAKKMEKEGPKEPPKQLVITLNADQMKHTDVLKLKKILHDSPGSAPVELVFQSAEKKIASIHIEGSFGVNLESSLASKLRDIPYIENMTLTKN